MHDVWYLHAYPDSDNPLIKRGPKADSLIAKCVAKAKNQTNSTLLNKAAERSTSGGWRLVKTLQY